MCLRRPTGFSVEGKSAGVETRYQPLTPAFNRRLFQRPVIVKSIALQIRRAPFQCRNFFGAEKASRQSHHIAPLARTTAPFKINTHRRTAGDGTGQPPPAVTEIEIQVDRRSCQPGLTVLAATELPLLWR
jgi:hypothetical protein